MKCVNSTESALKDAGVAKFSVDLDKQSVVVTSPLPTSKIQSILESTGKRAVVLGTSGPSQKSSSPAPSAVAMLGGLIGAGNIQGVVRFVQVRTLKESRPCPMLGLLQLI
jgi:copper chaperone for superoxide dismutase